jgi:hypothetical protein
MRGTVAKRLRRVVDQALGDTDPGPRGKKHLVNQLKKAHQQFVWGGRRSTTTPTKENHR